MMPFPGGVDSLANGTLLLSVAAALLYLPVQGRPPSLRRTIVKTAAVALLAVLAWIAGGPLLLVAAQEGETPFLAGLASFLAAHLAYVALFLSAGGDAAMLTAEPWRLALALLAAAGAVVLLRRLLPAAGPAMRVPVAVYAAAILAMLWAAATVPAPIILAGAALFVLSDSLLAIGRFLLPPDLPRQPATGAAVWVFYYLAQAAIALGFLL
jgi:uncharacterized membrane protein YhhN